MTPAATMPDSDPRFAIIKLANGASAVWSAAHGESFHPGVGPEQEAERLYVRQLHLPDRAAQAGDTFVLWDVGLGAAANALTAIRAIAAHVECERTLELVSFDLNPDAARFALQNVGQLGYLAGYENLVSDLIERGEATRAVGKLTVHWRFIGGDFPSRLASENSLPAPHAILFDPHSPKKNPEMWTVSLFANLLRRTDPERPCSLATFSRSTMARVAMLLGGWFVGAGHATGFKDETTVAASRLDLLNAPLDGRWLQRAERSDSAEPLREGLYRQQKLSAASLEELRQHPQFR
jgi:tRNA U34 5-methylaminomethyl-2-thiouridine-forming methyltransferase MnmC